MTRVAQISCGTEYSGMQWLLNEIAESVGIELVFPEVEYDDVERACEIFGLKMDSSSLNMMMARALSVLDDPTIKGVLLLTCFRCAEGAVMKNEIRRFLHEQTDLPIITYSNVEKPKEVEIYARLDALKTIITRKTLLMRERQEGLTLGVDSGSSTTKVVVMQDNKIVGKAWIPTTEPVKSASEAVEIALNDADVRMEDVEATGVTGYGRELVAESLGADLSLEEISVVSKGAAFLADRQRGEATVIDIGGMSNKVVTLRDGIPDAFALGGICGGSSGRFLEVAAHRLGVDISELGELALRAKEEVTLQSYCMVFGIQDLVVTLAGGASREDVAAAACRSVANQVYEHQMAQEIEIRSPVIFVGGVSLIAGVAREFEEMLRTKIIVPENSQFAGAVGMALLASGLRKKMF